VEAKGKNLATIPFPVRVPLQLALPVLLQQLLLLLLQQLLDPAKAWLGGL